MVNISPDEIMAIANQLYASRISTDMGDEGVVLLKRLLPVVRDVHLAVSTERISKGLVVVCSTDSDHVPLPGAAQLITDASALTAEFDGTTPLTIQIVAAGLKVWMDEVVEIPSGNFLAYRYSVEHGETFFSTEHTYEVPQISASASYFGMPYFRELRKALEQYGASWARNSACELLSRAWLDDTHNVFAPGPEIWMRRSLVRFLRSSFREYSSVMPEQKVSETRPVDIKITWGKYNRVALIEIKWLGKSAHAGSASHTQNHSAGRARDGSKQLAVYLDLYHVEAPNEEARGYLVVFDARRRALRLPLTTLNPADAIHFRHEQIVFDEQIVGRPDFEYPLRFFCEAAR